VGTIVGVTSSNPVKGLNVAQFNHEFNFDTSYYYAVIELQRLNTTQIQRSMEYSFRVSAANDLNLFHWRRSVDLSCRVYPWMIA
jgi:hypothetical protein